MAVTETWLNARIPNEYVNIHEDYCFVRKDREGRGGGVGMYVNRNIKFHKMNLNTTFNSFEYLLLKLHVNSSSIVLCAIYRSSSLSNFNEFFEEFECLCSTATTMSDFVMYVGDININVLDVHSNQVKNYLELLNTFNLSQIIDEPTRISLNSLTLIDHIIVSDNSLAKSWAIDHSHNISDHGIISCDIDVLKKKNLSLLNIVALKILIMNYTLIA